MEESLSIVCIHVLEGTRPVRFLSRSDGDLVLACGGEDHHVLDDWAMAHASHFTSTDPALGLARFLNDEEWAIRAAVGAPWKRSGRAAS